MTRAAQLTDPITEHGEGPVWWPDGHLRLVDMLAGDLVDVGADGSVTRTRVGAVAACVRPRRGGGAVVAIERGLLLLDAAGAVERTPASLWADRSVRMNEGGCDGQGRFYCGSMAYDAAPARGALYRWDEPGTAAVVLAPVTISNGLAFSADDALAYYVDTPTRRIDLLDHEPDGALTGRRPFVQLPDGAGNPDGIALDRDGGLWVACWGGGAVRHYDASGRPDEVVEVGTPHVSACTLGGPQLSTLYITTSRLDLPADDRTAAGAVFALPDVTPGRPVPGCRF